MLTKRHFIALADWFKDLPDRNIGKKELYHRLAHFCASNSQNAFHSYTFKERCGMEDWDEQIDNRTVTEEDAKLPPKELVEKIHSTVMEHFEEALIHKKALQKLMKLAGYKYQATKLTSEFVNDIIPATNHYEILRLCDNITSYLKTLEDDAREKHRQETEDGLFELDQ